MTCMLEAFLREAVTRVFLEYHIGVHHVALTESHVK